MLIEGKHLDDIENSYMIVLENSDLPFCLSTLHNLSIYRENFSFIADEKEYYVWIFGLENSTEDLVTKPLYETLDIVNIFDRCLILEWKIMSEYFSVYGGYRLFSDKLIFGVDDTKHGEINREIFLNAFDWFSSNKTLRTIGSNCMSEVEGWFFRVFGLYSSETEELLRKLKSIGVSIF